MKLNKKIRCEMVKNMILDLFSERVKNWKSTTSQKVSELILSENKKLIDWYESLDSDKKSLIATNSNTVLQFKNDDESTYYVECAVRAFIGEKPRNYNDNGKLICRPFDKYARSQCTYYDFLSFSLTDKEGELVKVPEKLVGRTYIAKSKKLTNFCKQIQKERLELVKLIEDAGNQFYAALESVTTLKRLEEVMPSATKYIPHPEEKPKSTQLVPTELYASINALLGDTKKC